MEIADERRWLEIALVMTTGIGKFIFMDMLNWRLPYILIACLFWLAYCFYRYQQQPNILSYWGLSLQGFKQTWLELTPFALCIGGLFVFMGYQLETSVLNWHILPILLLYPIWGIIQQFIIIALIAKNLSDLQKHTFSLPFIIVLTATIFASVHYPFPILIIGTFCLAIVYTLLYLKGRNLLVLGIYHGWLGGLFFYAILGRDPWLEVFGG